MSNIAFLIDCRMCVQTHIHYGLGEHNPVARLRFYPKHSAGPTAMGKELDERTYASILPRVFEDRKVRVFCRHHDKEYIARKAFEEWCREKNAHAPFPTKCESPAANMSEQMDEDGVHGGADGEDNANGQYLQEYDEAWTQFSQDE
jgi:hypothetical protein